MARSVADKRSRSAEGGIDDERRAKAEPEHGIEMGGGDLLALNQRFAETGRRQGDADAGNTHGKGDHAELGGREHPRARKEHKETQDAGHKAADQ